MMDTLEIQINLFILVPTLKTNTGDYILHLAHELLADSDIVIIPYTVIIRLFITIYGIVTESGSASDNSTNIIWLVD